MRFFQVNNISQSDSSSSSQRRRRLYSSWSILNGTFSFCYLTIPELIITMITDSCSCLSLSVSLFTLLTLLSSVSASDSLLPHAFVVIRHTEGKKMGKNTMGNFSLFSHDNDFHTIIVFWGLFFVYHIMIFSFKKKEWEML